MARPRSFDEQQVLTQCGEVFRRQGYEATSVDDLVAATGLKRGSLYQAFGSKQGVFLTVLQSVLQNMLDDTLRDLPADASIDTSDADEPKTKANRTSITSESGFTEEDNGEKSSEIQTPSNSMFSDDALTLVAITCLELAPHDAKARNILTDWFSRLALPQKIRLGEALGQCLLKRAGIGTSSIYKPEETQRPHKQ
ncbi:TetR/AcrR family transcriptional regulator [Bifidobacterium sp. ESL0798]|uniref:TetR/AcrR family transcriptional regulator n=1 Tax=Bifidobacterium sp. ESL0798 TaxID=2983235 RepID=UPI0023F9C6E7|nr:TetR/AcrR family transcriptional regulator [Bifidobacterium sp. ESL0798]WEV74433.1 TetR/AcrR family transcriptional regulator [Bifidobacterium sp. ESL0798]